MTLEDHLGLPARGLRSALAGGSGTRDLAREGLIRFSLLATTLSSYAALLHWTYQRTISPLFSYVGLRYREPEPISYGVAILTIILVGCFLPARLRRPSDFVLWVLFTLTGIPSVLVPHYADILPWADSITVSGVSAAAFLVVVLAVDLGPDLRLPRLQIRPETLWLFLGGISVLVYAAMLATTGLPLRVMWLTDVQATRFAYREALAGSGSTGLAYLIGIQGNVINPVVMARALLSRKLLLLVAGAAGQVLIYSVTGYKMMALSVPAVLVLALLYKRATPPSGPWIVGGSFLTGATALVVDRLIQTHEFSLVFIGRLALIPGALTSAHILVFKDMPKALWGHSFLAPFVEYPYTMPPPILVGAIFSGDAEVAANASFLGDGYANLGYVGIFVEALVVAVLLLLFNAAGRGLPRYVTASALLIPSLSLVNTGAFTSLLTGGCIFALLLLMALPREGWSSVDRDRRHQSREASLQSSKRLPDGAIRP